MKNQTQGKFIFAIVALLFTALLVSGVLAQVARSNTWVAPSDGITVTVTTPMQPQGTVVYNFVGTGKNGAPKGIGVTTAAPPPTSCPRDPKTEAYYSETKDIKDKNGKTIAKIKITRNTNCSVRQMNILDEKGNNPITLTNR